MDRRPLGAPVVITVLRGSERGISESPGMSSLHCFSSGDWYDPANVAFGPVVGLDEHILIPGTAFDWHAHRGVHILSWILGGTLRHQDSSAGSLVADDMLLQSTGDGIRHRESNAGDVLLRMVQLTVLGDEPGPARLVSSPVQVGPVEASVSSGPCVVERGLVFCAGGSFGWPGGTLWPGDSLRTDETVSLDGAGRLLVVRTVG